MAKIKVSARNLYEDTENFEVTVYKDNTKSEKQDLLDKNIDPGKIKTKNRKLTTQPKKYVEVDVGSESDSAETTKPIKDIKVVFNSQGKLELTVRNNEGDIE